MNDATIKIVPAARAGNGGNGESAVRRQLKISVLRYNPQEPAKLPRMQTYPLEEADGMTLFIALNEIREKQDPSLQFDFVCRAGICGSCAMVIDGRLSLRAGARPRAGRDHKPGSRAAGGVDPAEASGKCPWRTLFPESDHQALDALAPQASAVARRRGRENTHDFS